MMSGAAMWTFIVATSWLVLDKYDSSTSVGIITFASMLPFLVVSPIAGVMADRLDRKDLALLTFCGGLAIVSTVTALVVVDVLEFWSLALLTFLGGTFRAMQEPAIQALIPNQVPSNDLLNAITLNASTRHGARFFGLIVASPMLAIEEIGVAGVLAISASFHAVGTLLLTRIRTKSSGDLVSHSGILKGMREGLVYIYSNHVIALFITLVAFHCALVMSFESILPIFSIEQLGARDGSILGYLTMGFGIGALTFTLLMAGVRNEKRKGQYLIITGIVGGIAPATLALLDGLLLSIAICVVMGGAQATFMALTNTYVQAVSSDRIRGRVSSLYILHAGGIMAFANLGYGFMADLFSASLILLITGFTFIIFMTCLSFGQPILRNLYVTGKLPGPSALV